ncbi:MAG TPA: TonB-dependent receptor [Caulobacteraceae bacterium]|jgi:outer membrane receptor protein involved in Fe transport|nr:TonB-dependent receptor [Caulobacteraceae bacterium]
MRTRLLASSMISGIALIIAPAAAHAADATANAMTSTAAPVAGSSASAPISTITAAGDATATSDTPANVSEIVVTGSRIPQANLTSVSPITQVNQTQIRLQGISDIGDLINQLPQAVGDFGNFESNGATGTSTIDLRALGNKRTLVLVNGQRLAPGDPTTGDVAPDINIIPPALVDRVEVLTGGASAVYGSDAIAGVVNFIMKTHFQGLSVDEQTSFAQDDGGNKQVRTADANSVLLGQTPISFPGNTVDGWRQTVTVTGGVNAPDDKGNVEFYLGYTYIQAVNEGQRDYSKCTLATNNTSTSFQYCGGSSTDATGRLVPQSGPNNGKGFNILGTPVGGTLPPFASGQDYNYAPINYFQRPDERYTAGEFSDYQLTPWLDVYSSLMFMDDYSTGAVAASGSFFGDEIFNIPCNDPLLSSAQATALCGPTVPATATTAASGAGTATVGTAEIGRRNVEGGARTANFEHEDFRMVLGGKGDIGGGWTYDLSGSYTRNTLSESQGGYFLNSHLLNALDVVTSPSTGKPVCASVLAGTDTACVPYNIFSPGGVTSDALNYLTGLAENSGYITEQIVNLNVANGDLSKYGIKSPWATDGAGVSLGVEYRADSLQTLYDAAIASGDLAGFGGGLKSTSGDQMDGDLYGELRVPLVQNQPFAKDMEFEAGYRYADYSHGGGTNTFKLGLDWQTVPDLRLRASFERAVRAPNVEELFEPDSPGLFAGSDPCAGSAPLLTAAQCVNTFQKTLPGITVAQLTGGGYVFDGHTLPALYGAIPQCVAAQCGAFSGGNPNLKPETANTFSVGGVITPSFFHNFSMSIDYWNIDVGQAILNVPGTTIVTNCGLINSAFDCAQISRFFDPTTGQGGGSIFGGEGLGSVTLPLVNAGALKTSGIDFQASYRANLDDWNIHGMGALLFDFNGTYTFNQQTTLPDGTTYDCVGLYGPTCSSSNLSSPKWRHNFRVTWNTPWNATFSLNWRYIGGESLDFNTSQPDLQDGGFKDLLPTDSHIPAYNYIDLAMTWRIRDHIGIRAGVNNVADLTPPLLDANSFGISAPPFGNGNTFPESYDPLGRTFFMGVTADF